MKKLLTNTLAILAFLAASGATASAGFIVYTGYNDDPNENPLPNPWVNSPNTIVVGSAAQLALANSFDPDMNAVRFLNTGATPLVLSSLTFTPSNIDLFALNGQVTPVVINPGQNLIVLGVDGSETLGGVQTVHFTLDGTPNNFLDAVTADAFDGVLFGKVNWISAETEPWTQIGTDAATPEPSSLALGLIACGLAGGAWWRKRRAAA